MRISDWSSDVCSSDLADTADGLEAAATDDAARNIARRLKAKAKYYDEARQLARLASQVPCDDKGCRHFVVCSGGGPSIMEAATRGAADEGRASDGRNIAMPPAQAPHRSLPPPRSLHFPHS